MVEQLIRNQQVTGSSPVNGSNPASARRMRFFSVATFSLLMAAALRAQCPAFSDAVYYNNMPAEPRAIAVADFNGDGKADLAVFGYTNTVGAGGPPACYLWLQ